MNRLGTWFDSGWPAVLIAAVAGFADAVGYLVLSGVFTAHMSGNAAAAGAYAGHLQWRDAWARGAPIPGFIVGVALGAIVARLTHRSQIRERLAPALALELALLVVFAGFCPAASPGLPTAPSRSLPLTWLLALAMGIQGATLRCAGDERVTTTFVTGMLVNMVEELVDGAFSLLRRSGAFAARQHAAHVLLFGGIFCAFMLGAFAGSIAEEHWGGRAMLVAAAALVVAIADDVWRGTGAVRRCAVDDRRGKVRRPE